MAVVEQEEPRCLTCRDAGVVWARALALPRGFRIMMGSMLTRSKDRQHVEITCPACNGYAAKSDSST